jgi:tetratricopeptide (TPR) repeat protein/DNA-directed RNA polymerase subunit RPC12/RpoP
MIAIQCTSCKKALEVDEGTLSSREPSVVRCPNCGVSLMVDKRKSTGPIVTGPVVHVAKDVHKPLLPTPSEAELEQTGGSGHYVSILASIYHTAETFLETNVATARRVSDLRRMAHTGHEAIAGLALSMPSVSGKDDVREVQQTPDGRRFDTKLRTLSLYLARTRSAADLAGTIWKNATAAHRYEPIRLWQGKARIALESANTAASSYASDLDRNVAELEEAVADYGALETRHRTEHDAFVTQIGAQEQTLARLRAEEATASDRCEQLEREASSNASAAFKAAGCGGLVVAAILAFIAAVAMRSSAAGWIVFLLAASGISFVSHQMGFNKNEHARTTAEKALSSARSAVRTADRELTRFREQLTLHDAIAPTLVPDGVGGQWSLLNCVDFDPDTQRQPVSSNEEAASSHAFHTNAVPEHQPVVSNLAAIPAGIIATSLSAAPRPAGDAGAPSALTRSVGFIATHDPRTGSASRADVSPTLGEASTFPSAEPEPSAIAPAARIASTPKRAIVGAIAAIVLIASYFIWSANFSLHAKLNKAVASGQIFAPAGTCVYDLYKTELARNPTSKILAEFNPIIRNAIGPAADDSFARWYKDSDDTVSWPDLERTCNFLSSIDPATKLHQIRKLYAAAQQSIDRREYSKALTNYEEALRLDPTWTLALNGVGKVYMIERSPFYNERLGVAYYKRACETDPGFTWAPKNLGDYYARKNDYALAEQYLRRALATSPERPSILRALGSVCRKSRRPAEAMAFYERALQFEKDPDKVATIVKAMSAIRGDR